MFVSWHAPMWKVNELNVYTHWFIGRKPFFKILSCGFVRRMYRIVITNWCTLGPKVALANFAWEFLHLSSRRFWFCRFAPSLESKSLFSLTFWKTSDFLDLIARLFLIFCISSCQQWISASSVWRNLLKFANVSNVPWKRSKYACATEFENEPRRRTNCLSFIFRYKVRLETEILIKLLVKTFFCA